MTQPEIAGLREPKYHGRLVGYVVKSKGCFPVREKTSWRREEKGGIMRLKNP